MSNFLKRDAVSGKNIVTLQDMEQLNEELILPALKLTKSNNFIKLKEDGEPEAPRYQQKKSLNNFGG